jgi:hypothetical protein
VMPVRIGRGKVLVVDDDGGSDFEQYYENAVMQSGIAHDLWSVTSSGTASAAEMQQYASIIWSCGNEAANTLTSDDRTALAAYLNGGGRLMLVGQNIDIDLRSSSFYTDYLHVQSENLSGSRQLAGIGGNSISSGLTLQLSNNTCAGNGALHPSRILPVNGAAAVFNYATGGTGAVMFSGHYEVVYFAFALEAACGGSGSNSCSQVVAAVLRWMNVLDAVSPPPAAVPTEIVLHDNFPNPFNPSTVLTFEIPARMSVDLRVFNILGREVAVLARGDMLSGVYRFTFDGSNMSSGIYLARLQAGSTVRSRKMVLTK